jgi:hypothetical protein
MKKLLILFCFVGLLSFPLMAEDYPKAEIFGGYQFLHSEGENTNGWNASLTGNFNKYLGVTGDFGGAYETVDVLGTNVNVRAYTYTGGPVLNLNHEGTVNPFVHALFGGVHFTGSAPGFGSGSLNGFTMMYGGGADLKMSKLLALRGQVDWVYLRVSGVSSSKNVRLSTGIVLRF